MYNFKDIVLVDFPFSDISSSKKRPALVLLDMKDSDVLVARITTKSYNSAFDIEIFEWQIGGLLAPSFIRLHKIFTLNEKLINRKIGELQFSDGKKVNNVLTRLLSEIIVEK